MKLKNGDITTISIPKELKKKLDEVKGEETYYELLERLLGVFSLEVIEELDLLRRPGEGYGDVILRVLRAGRRDADELEGFLHLIRRDREEGKIHIVGDKVRIVPPECGR
jgi:predicted CopG family antitoxin